MYGLTCIGFEQDEIMALRKSGPFIKTCLGRLLKDHPAAGPVTPPVIVHKSVEELDVSY